MNAYSGKCTATLTSLTQAQKAQKALALAAIPSNIVKTEPASSLRGCAYGLEFSCNQRNNIARVLGTAGISVKKWNTED